MSYDLPSRHVVFEALKSRQSSGPPPQLNYPPGFLEQSRATEIVVGNAVVQAIGTLFVLARAYSRLFIIGTWKPEDWVLIVAWLFATGYSVGAYGQVAHGAGRHLAALSNFQDAVTSQKYAFANNLILFFAIAMPKISICLAYLRIFYSDIPGRRLIQALMVLLVLLIIPFFVETLCSCTPISAYWNELRPDDKCLQDLAGLYVHGSLNAAVDIALMAILVPRILALKMNSRQKAVLLGIVSLGSLAVIAAVVRMVRVGTTLGMYGKDSFGIPDPPWDTYDVTIWTSTEIYVSLICAAAPGVKPLVGKLLPHLLGTTFRSRTRTTGNHAYGTGPIELSGKVRRSTLATSGSMHKTSSAAGLTAGSGPWIEVGRGADQESNPRSSEDTYHEALRGNGIIIKKSEIMIERGDTRSAEPPHGTAV